jgi:hypothetical protein
MKSLFTLFFLLTVLVCILPDKVNSDAVAPIRFVKRGAPALRPAPVVESGPPQQVAPGVEPPAPKEEKGEDAESKPKSTMNITPQSEKDLRSMVEAFVRLVNGLRNNGAIRLPDPFERLMKEIAEDFDKVQDALDIDLDIDTGNLLNSGGK